MNDSFVFLPFGADRITIKMSCVPLPSGPSTHTTPPQVHKDFFVTVVLPFSEGHKNGILQYAGLCCIFFYSVRCIQVMWVLALIWSVWSSMFSIESFRFSNLWRPSHMWLPLLRSPTLRASHQASRPLLLFRISNSRSYLCLFAFSATIWIVLQICLLVHWFSLQCLWWSVKTIAL